jgi:hypothetical protein
MRTVGRRFEAQSERAGLRPVAPTGECVGVGSRRGRGEQVAANELSRRPGLRLRAISLGRPLQLLGGERHHGHLLSRCVTVVSSGDPALPVQRLGIEHEGLYGEIATRIDPADAGEHMPPQDPLHFGALHILER